jgi:hypothetical protein
VRRDADSIEKKTKSQQPPREEKRKSDSTQLRRGQCVRALLESARLSFHQSAAPYVRALERNARVLVGMRAELLRRGAVATGSAALVHPHSAPLGGLGGLVPEAGPRYVSTPNASGVDHDFVPSLEQILRAASLLVADCNDAETHDRAPASLEDCADTIYFVAPPPPIPLRPAAWRIAPSSTTVNGMLNGTICLNPDAVAAPALLEQHPSPRTVKDLAALGLSAADVAAKVSLKAWGAPPPRPAGNRRRSAAGARDSRQQSARSPEARQMPARVLPPSSAGGGNDRAKGSWLSPDD